MNKNEAVFKWIKKCPAFKKLFFNFGTAKKNTADFIPVPTDYTVKADVLGNETKWYDFAVSVFGSVDDTSFDGSENFADTASLENLTEWIKQKNRERDFPDFGENCTVEKVTVIQNIPASMRIQNISKYLAQYRIIYEEIN